MKRFFLIVLIAAIASTSWACASKDQKNTETAASHTSKKSTTTKPKVTPSKTTFANDTVKDIEAASADIESALQLADSNQLSAAITSLTNDKDPSKGVYCTLRFGFALRTKTRHGHGS